MFLLFYQLSVFSILGFVFTILLDTFILKIFNKSEDGLGIFKTLYNITFVKFPAVFLAMFFGGILGGLGLMGVNLFTDISDYAIYFSLAGFSIVYIYFYKDFLNSAVNTLEADIGMSDKNYYIITIISLILTIGVEVANELLPALLVK